MLVKIYLQNIFHNIKDLSRLYKIYLKIKILIIFIGKLDLSQQRKLHSLNMKMNLKLE